MSFIEDEIPASKNPLYGRTPGIYKMLPLPFSDAVKFFPNYSDEDKIIAYSILGGIPHYLQQFDNSLSIEDNIKQNILTKGTVLYNEIEFLLRQELRETTVYNTIIEAIALGNTVLNDIYLKVQLDKPKLSVYLKNLSDLGIVEREFPVLSKTKERANTNRGEYKLTDDFFRFWYAFAYSNFSDLEEGSVNEIWEYKIKNNLHHFASKAFENIAISYLRRTNRENRLPFRFQSIGRWWGNITHRNKTGKPFTQSEEIDILAADDIDNMSYC